MSNTVRVCVKVMSRLTVQGNIIRMTLMKQIDLRLMGVSVPKV